MSRLTLARWLAAFGLSALLSSSVHAEAPQAQGQAPGWYRMMLGRFEITALSDGTVPLPVHELFTNLPGARVQQMLARQYLKSPLETSVNEIGRAHV